MLQEFQKREVCLLCIGISLMAFFLPLGVKTGKAFLTPEMFPSTSVSKHVVLSSQACRFDFFIFNLLEREWRQKWDL